MTSRLMGVLLFLIFIHSAAADTLEDAVEKLTAAEAKLKSMTAKFKVTQDMDFGDGNRVKSDRDGTVEWMRKGDKKLHRTTMNTRSVQNMGGQETKTEQTTLMISDGDYTYAVSEDKGQKSAFKQKADPSMDESAKSIVENLKEAYALKLLPDGKVDGADCVVIEGAAKDAQGDPMVKQVFYFRKDSGVNVKMVGLGKEGKPMLSHTLSDIKLNSEIPADQFVFKAPEGVKVMDLTQAPEAPDKQP